MVPRPILFHSSSLAESPLFEVIRGEHADFRPVAPGTLGSALAEVAGTRPAVLLLDDALLGPSRRASFLARVPSLAPLRVVTILEVDAPDGIDGLRDDMLACAFSPPIDGTAFARAVRGALREVGYQSQCEHLDDDLRLLTGQLKELNRIGIALSTEHDQKRLLSLILRTICDFTASDGGSILLIETDPQGKRVLRFKLFQNDSIPTSTSAVAQFSIPIDPSTLAGYVAATGKALNIGDVHEIGPDAPYAFNPSFDERMGYRTKSMLVLPMKNHLDKTIGVIQLINRKKTPDSTLDLRHIGEDVIRYDARSLELANSLASQAAVCLENDMLYEGLERKVKERTNELEHAMSELVEKEKLASVGQLTAGVAHEINNPLAFGRNNLHLARERVASVARRIAIQGWLGAATSDSLEKRIKEGDALLERVEKDANLKSDVKDVRNDLLGLPPNEHATILKEFLTYVLKRKDTDEGTIESVLVRVDGLLEQGAIGLDRVAEIVVGLRNFARLDEAVFQDADVDLGIKNTLAILGASARERQVRVIQKLGLTRHFPCFPAKLNQVILNLVNNAIDACEKGGEVVVASEERDGYFEINVKDNGHGIPEGNLSKIFVPFFTTKPVGKGTGLGLSISYRIVQEHKGTIAVRRNETGGTTFSVRIPVKQSP